MAKVQTRRSLSFSRPMHEAIKARAAVLGKSAAQYLHECVAAEMLAANIEAPKHGGYQPLRPTPIARPVAPRETYDVAAASAKVNALLARVQPAAPSKPSGFCAVCTETIIGEPNLEPIGKGGALVKVCNDCCTLDPRSGKYAFDECGRSDGATPIVGRDGNKRRRSA
jgi:hypothetical protein